MHCADGQWLLDMVFRDPYILNFLNLSDGCSERGTQRPLFFATLKPFCWSWEADSASLSNPAYHRN